MANALLSDAQLAQFEEQGFLLVSGLLDPKDAARAEAAMWERIGARPDDPTTWEGKGGGVGTENPLITSCVTPQMAEAAAMISGEDAPGWQPPKSVFLINTFPQPGGGTWEPHGPHIDHAIPRDGYRTFPRPMRLASLIYLNDVRHHGGGTAVWPGSHQKILTLGLSDPERFALMATLNQAIDTLDLGEPQEVLGKAGDILFYHYLCAHSGSNNVADYPRFAIAYKW